MNNLRIVARPDLAKITPGEVIEVTLKDHLGHRWPMKLVLENVWQLVEGRLITGLGYYLEFRSSRYKGRTSINHLKLQILPNGEGWVRFGQAGRPIRVQRPTPK